MKILPVNSFIRQYSLALIIEALERYQIFDPVTRTFAIKLHASELGINQLHFYAIAFQAGLVGGVA